MFIKQRRWLGVVAAVTLCLAAAAGVLGYRAAQGDPSWVARVNGYTITTHEWNGYQTVVARNGGAGSAQASLEHVIDDRLQLQEAARRGLTCSRPDTLAFIQQYDATDRAAGVPGLFALLNNAYAGGFATQDMLIEAATARALPPGAETAIAAYEAAPDTIAALTNLCTLSRLSFAAEGATPPSETPRAEGASPLVPGAPRRPDALQTLVARLRASATIELAATAAPAATRTPTP